MKQLAWRYVLSQLSTNRAIALFEGNWMPLGGVAVLTASTYLALKGLW